MCWGVEKRECGWCWGRVGRNKQKIIQERSASTPTKTCTTFYYQVRTEHSTRRERENYRKKENLFCFHELMDMEKQKGDGLQAIVIRSLCHGLNSPDSSSVLIKMTNIISSEHCSVFVLVGDFSE